MKQICGVGRKLSKRPTQKLHQRKHEVPKNRKNSCAQNVPIFSANCAGCANKVISLLDNVNHLGAGIITLQETHFKRKGKLNRKLEDFEIFEAIRKKQKRRDPDSST